MGGLTPLGVRLLMAMAAVLCRRKALGIDELARVCRGIGRQKRLIRSKAIVIVLADRLRIGGLLRGEEFVAGCA